MSGSFNHICNDKDGSFRMGPIEDMGEAEEALEECHWLIWQLAGGDADKIRAALNLWYAEHRSKEPHSKPWEGSGTWAVEGDWGSKRARAARPVERPESSEQSKKRTVLENTLEALRCNLDEASSEGLEYSKRNAAAQRAEALSRVYANIMGVIRR